MCPPVGKAHSSMSKENHTADMLNVHFQIRNHILTCLLTFTSGSIDITQLVPSATVALIRAINVGTLLTAGIALTFIHICMSAEISQIKIILLLKSIISYSHAILVYYIKQRCINQRFSSRNGFYCYWLAGNVLYCYGLAIITTI